MPKCCHVQKMAQCRFGGLLVDRLLVQLKQVMLVFRCLLQRLADQRRVLNIQLTLIEKPLETTGIIQTSYLSLQLDFSTLQKRRSKRNKKRKIGRASCRERAEM